MSSFQKPGLALLAVAASIGCVESDPTTPERAVAEQTAYLAGSRAARSPVDVSGEWRWSREEILTVPAAFAFIFGFEPEGPVTHFRCSVQGTITLDQEGAELSGLEVETASRCETRGGQVAPQPGLGVLIPISEGRITGSVVHLLIGDLAVPCPIRAVVEEASEGVALSMSGTGRCIIPGHPKSMAPEGSPLDLDPPPGGTEKIVTWRAERDM